ncbi:DUF2398 family protein [Nocardiopsis sp. RSe5-2]|uniref:DUF2398 family protein n=1 Tax=Nocardiopsis endophytica TaxID=3018445 RepID=A0ABT4UE94_9ACTN|nr:DUF2398 family protein [Nocardiopsis endophytica]MDA2815197.1 DUF2398 family protein [Nocardiopsis endophytica]
MIDDIALTGERQAAARRLLRTPVLSWRTHPRDLALVRAHSDWLVQRFRRVLGYELVVEADHARLVKAGPPGDAPPPRRASGAPLTPRAYAYLALTLAALPECGARTDAGELAERVRAAAAEAGLPHDPRARAAERRAFTAALRHLASWGVVAERGEGALDDHAAGTAPAVGLDVDAEAARRALAHPPHSASGPAEFLRSARDPDPDTDDEGEVALRRLLAEQAVVYREDLPERQRGRLARHQWRAAAELGALLGCETEVRAEGVALVMPDGDPDGDEEAHLPGTGPEGRAALLLVRGLAGRVRPPATPARGAEVPEGVLAEELDAALPAGPGRGDLRERVLRRLCEAGLLRAVEPGGDGGWELLAAAARYGPERPRIRDNGPDRPVPAAAGTGGSSGTDESGGR